MSLPIPDQISPSTTGKGESGWNHIETPVVWASHHKAQQRLGSFLHLITLYTPPYQLCSLFASYWTVPTIRAKELTENISACALMLSSFEFNGSVWAGNINRHMQMGCRTPHWACSQNSHTFLMITSSSRTAQTLDQSWSFDVYESECVGVFLTVVHQAAPACPRQHVSSSCSPLPHHTTQASLGRGSHLLDQSGHLHTVLQREGRTDKINRIE